ncbi:hypothetical protein CPC16_009195 [Podila verticillata]|nr:hypothetical protein CPC16_009195 [Podila verticillata]
MLELCFQNVRLQKSRDWELIVDSLDFSLLKILDLGSACIGQLISMPNAADIFISSVEHAREDTELAKLVLRALTLDISVLSQPDLAAVQGILSVCRLEELRVECPPFDPRLSASFAQVLASVRWTSLEHLDLTGDNINEWIQLLPNIETPQLQSLSIQGIRARKAGTRRFEYPVFGTVHPREFACATKPLPHPATGPTRLGASR